MLGGWILTGVFINRNFINKVNEAGNVVVDKSGKVVEILKHKVVLHGRAAGEDGAAEDIPEPAPKPGPKAGRTAARAVESGGTPRRKNPPRSVWNVRRSPLRLGSPCRKRTKIPSSN